ncbi:MAG TPA: hypothetical protein VFU10_07340 [Gaiellaceae bacterium]|nr:hypothetical protein [Gaiellaceae bacterium]
MRAKSSGAVFAAALAAIAVGCGGSGRVSRAHQLSEAQYQHKLQVDGRPLMRLGPTLTCSRCSATEFAKRTDAFDAAARKAADDLDATTPPKDAEHDNEAIVAGLRALPGLLDEFKKVMTSEGDSLRAMSDLENSPELKAADQAATDLEKKGYKLGGFFGS